MQTVTGPQSVGAGETILPHEHLFIDLRFISTEPEGIGKALSLETLEQARYDYTSITDNLCLDSLETAVAEIRRFAKAGGGAIVDVSSIGCGRRPDLLVRLAQATGLAIVMGSGFYVGASLPPEIIAKSEAELCRQIVGECENGTLRGGVAKPGIIGEIGISPELNAWDRKSLAAACDAQRETGLPLTIHIQAVPTIEGFDRPNGLDVVRFVEKAGVPLDRTVIDHVDARIDVDYVRSILATGAYAEFDHFGKAFYFPDSNFQMSGDMDRVECIAQLASEGYADRILVSTDICLKTDLAAYGGHGYHHIGKRIIPMMLENGFSEDLVQQLTHQNIARLLETPAKIGGGV